MGVAAAAVSLFDDAAAAAALADAGISAAAAATLRAAALVRMLATGAHAQPQQHACKRTHSAHSR